MNGPNNTNNNITIFLLGGILNVLAAVDYTSLLDYSLKAVIGGIIWVGFKLLGEYLTLRMKNKSGHENY